MASPPSRADLAGAPTVATYKLAIGALYDYVASLLGNGTATIASETEKKLARESLGVGNFGFKNRLINPEFSIDQRSSGSASTITAGAAIKYIVDRWYATCTGANITAQQIAGISDNQYSLRLTGASSNSAIMIGQRIESANCYDLKNKDVTVSLNAKSTSARTLTWTAYYADVADVFTAKTSIATGTIDVTTSVEKFTFTFNAGSNAGNGIAIEFTGGALLAGSTIDFDSVQLEQSAIATEFEKRSTQNELILCQRYYLTVGYSSSTSILQAGTSSGGAYFNTLLLPTKMRAIPTATIDVFSALTNCASPTIFGASADTIILSVVPATAARWAYSNATPNTGIRATAEI